MLAEAHVVVNLASSDLERTVAFYEGTLGLPVETRRELLEGHPEVLFRAGGATICIERGTPSPAPNPPFTFVVEDVPATVAALRDRGVVIEEYDLPFLRTEDGIATLGSVRLAWFKDPDGHLLGVMENPQPNP